MIGGEQHERDQGRGDEKREEPQEPACQRVRRGAENHQRTDARRAEADGQGKGHDADVFVGMFGGMRFRWRTHDGHGGEKEQDARTDAKGVKREAESAEDRITEKVEHRPDDEYGGPCAKGCPAFAPAPVILRASEEGAENRRRREQGEEFDHGAEQFRKNQFHTDLAVCPPVGGALQNRAAENDPRPSRQRL